VSALAEWQAMRVAYELKQSDFTEAFTAHRSKSSATQWIRLAFFWLIILLWALVLYGAVKSHNLSSALPFSVIAFLWVVAIEGIFPRWYMRRQTRNRLAHTGREH
jgi:amino acid transporter